MKLHKGCLFGLLLSLFAPGRAAAMDWKQLGGIEAGVLNSPGWDLAADVLDRWAWRHSGRELAAQERTWGLFLPGKIDEKRPLVILVHGLDGDRGSCADLSRLLEADGFQTGVFCYAGEAPLGCSAAILAENCRALHETFPKLTIDFVTQSMGGLIVRDYVEGDDYRGGVDRLIMICPPNEGSKWAALSPISKLAVNEWRWRHDPGWSAVWMIGEGLCQAGRDLVPDSRFLGELNERERCAGVKYTIIAGNEPVGDRVAADFLEVVGNALPLALDGAWPSKQIHAWATAGAEALRFKIGASDGPVSLQSAGLAGVGDVVVVHADHLALFESEGGGEPAAWPVIRQRLEASDGH